MDENLYGQSVPDLGSFELFRVTDPVQPKAPLVLGLRLEANCVAIYVYLPHRVALNP